MLLLSGILSLGAQTPKPPTPLNIQVVPGKNVLRNGGFESPRVREDAWDGVDAGGFLYGDRDEAPILTPGGEIKSTPLPVSVAIGDMNGDGLPDIVMMDVVGYLHIYFNSGSPTEPKFTQAELAPIFLSRASFDDVPNNEASFYVRTSPRVALADTAGNGKLDLYIGNYWGEVFFVPNSGTGVKPDFRQPADIKKLLMPTTKDSVTKWGNIFSPVVWDWNKDGKLDLLIGEGSYSANNIHLLINSGSSGRPIFEEGNRAVIAFGDGLEQLSPAVVDYNGDGSMDLLVGERAGKLALYLNKGDAWKPGVELPFASYVSSSGGSQLNYNGIFTVATGDLNGDGLFDIVTGKSSGRISVAYNTGTKTEPKFAAPVELKGDAGTPAMKLPSGWDIDFGVDRGNFYGYATMVTAEEDPEAAPPEGKSCLKFGYRASPNKIMGPPVAANYTPAFPEFSKREGPLLGEANGKSRLVLCNGPANSFMVRLFGFQLKNNQSYTLSFKVKGTGVSSGLALFGWEGRLQLGEDRVNVLDRGVEVKKNELIEYGKASIPINPSMQWTEVKRDITTSFKEKRLNEGVTLMRSALEITFLLQPMAGSFYIDDVQLIPK